MAPADLMHDVPDDLGARLAARRKELGLTVEEVERQAGFEAGYVSFVEEQSATPSPDALTALARALETPLEQLTGAGPAGASAHPRLQRLDHRAGLELIEGGGVGRVAMARNYAPIVLPVNFILDGGDVVMRTTDHSRIAEAARARDRVSFEVDHLNEELSEGWSVVATGRLEVVPDHEAEALRGKVTAWAGNTERRLIVRLVPRTLTGRRIVHG